MTRFERLVEAIKLYDNESAGIKVTAHHSAVSVRVEEMKKALGDCTQEATGDSSVPIVTEAISSAPSFQPLTTP